jgi:hypothetical protein
LVSILCGRTCGLLSFTFSFSLFLFLILLFLACLFCPCFFCFFWFMGSFPPISSCHLLFFTSLRLSTINKTLPAMDVVLVFLFYILPSKKQWLPMISLFHSRRSHSPIFPVVSFPSTMAFLKRNFLGSLYFNKFDFDFVSGFFSNMPFDIKNVLVLLLCYCSVLILYNTLRTVL